MLITTSLPAASLSLSLDSIAQWGKFPRFCVNTYKWGCDFFNGYDTSYVEGTGYKFNVKAKADSWMDYYNFDLPNNMQMVMHSDPSTTAGVWLTYLAVSVGYDRNISRFFGSSTKSKQQFTFGFDCSLFSVYTYYINNKVGNTISRFGPRGHTTKLDIDFGGMDIHEQGIDLYYFFNHKKYSQAAAFSFSRIQRKSQGTFYAGLSYSNQEFDFNFGSLPEYILSSLPTSWVDYRYSANTKNFAFKLGYGYNWVFAKNWVLGIQESPTIGLKHGYVNNPDKIKNSFALYNQLRMSVVWNHGRWFAGALGNINMGIFYDKDNTFITSLLSANISVGYRFNIW